MIPGAWLDAASWLAALCALAAAAVALRASRRPEAAPPSTWAPGLLAAATAIPAALLLYLATRFLATDLSYEYVFFYTGTEVAWPWRLAGTWAGREGSLLLWTVLLGLASLAVAWSAHRGRDDDRAGLAERHATLAVVAFVLALFLMAVAQQSPFAATDANLLEGRPKGNGLNPTLASPFMLIHPPMMFAAYAVATVPLAATLSSLATGGQAWSRIATPWARLGWLLMTFALGLGSLWAYYTLGFGGYWAWDPVEVANLLPWLAFTLLLHAQLRHVRNGAFANMGPLLAALPFLLTLFSTISTRSGLWVSVHAFTDPTDTFNPDAAARFLDILAADPTLGFHVGLLVAGTAAFLALWTTRLSAAHGRLRRPSLAIAGLLALFAAYALLAPRSATSALLEAGSLLTGGSAGLGLLLVGVLAFVAAAAPMLASGEAPASRPARPEWIQRIGTASLAAYAVLALGLALLVLFLLHVAAAQQGTSARFYEERLPWLALPVLLGILVFQAHELIGRRRSLLLAGGAAALGIAAWIFARTAGEHRLGQGLLLGLPALTLAVAAFLRVRRALSASPAEPRRHLADGLLLLAALLDALFWLNPPTVRLGPLAWTPVWPAQALFGAVALWGLWSAARLAAGAAPRRSAGVHAIVALLGGFYVAPVLAAASWVLRGGLRRGADEPTAVSPVSSRPRLHQAALHAIHLAIAIALVGYAASTYLQQEREAELGVGDSTTVAGFAITFEGTEAAGATGLPADHLAQRFRVERAAAPQTHVEADLTWQGRAGAHYPLPATMRAWSRDLYVDVSAIHVAAGSPCLGPAHPDGAWIEAYRASSPSRVCAGDVVDAVRMRATVLPGLGLLWLALAVGVGGMAVLMATPRSTPAGPPSSGEAAKA